MDAILRILEDAGLITLDGSDGLRLTESFTESVKTKQSLLENTTREQTHSELETRCGDETAAELLLKCSEVSPEVLQEYFVVSEIEELSHQDRLLAISVISPLRNQHSSNRGVPESFVAVSGNRIPFLVNVFSRAIVYVWKRECLPCDVMKGELESVTQSGLGDIALFAVYGPSAIEVLADHYRVDGAPTTLFFVNGSVDSRIRGASYRNVIETEVEKLREIDD